MFKSKVKKNTVSKTSEILSKEQPFSYREAYNALRTNFNFASLDGQLKTIAITSTIPGEGKTTFSINLAISMIEMGKKVLLIDADLRNPSIHRYLRLRQQEIIGLSHLLSSKHKLTESVGHLEKLKLDIVLSGPIPPNPVELLSSGNFDKILEEAKGEYDLIIIDTPPVGIVTDASVISQFADGVIVVVGQGKPTVNQIKKTKSNLERVNANVIGSVLNNYDSRKDNKSSGDDYFYYYGNGE